MSLQGDKEEYSIPAPMSVEEMERHDMAMEATARLFDWVMHTELVIPPQVALDIGIVIGRLRMLEGA